MQLYCRLLHCLWLGSIIPKEKKRRGEKRTTYRKKEPWGRNSHSTGKRRRECVCVRVCDAKGERERERERVGQNKDKKTVLLLLYSFILILESNCWTDSTYLDSSRIKSLQFSILCCMQHRHIEKHEYQQHHRQQQ